MLKKILSVSGKPGLYKMVSQGKNLLIVESLVDKKRIPTYIRDKVISLSDIAIYTINTEVPLYQVLTRLKEKEQGELVAAEVIKSTPEDLRLFMEELLPDFDRERVYPTDIKHLLNWYNILINAGITDFETEKSEESLEEPAASTKADEPLEDRSTASVVEKKSATAKKAPKKG